MPFGVTPSNDNGGGVGDGVGGGYGTDDTDSSVEQGAEKGREDGAGSSEHVLRNEEEEETEEEQEEEEKTDEERENSDGEYNVSEGPLDDYDYDDIVAEEDQAEAGVDQKTQTLDGASDEGRNDGGDANTEQKAPGDSSGKASDGRKDDDVGAHEESNQESVPPMEGQHARDRDSSRSGSGERHDDVAGEIKGKATEKKKEKEDSQSSKGTLSEFSLSDLTEESHAHEDEEEEQKGVETSVDEAAIGSDTEQGTSATDEEEEKKEEESTEGDTATKATNEETNDGERSLSERYRLTKELAASVASLSGQTSGTSGGKGVVVVTWANFHYKDFVMNWVGHLNATGCKAFLVGAMDDQLLKVLVDRDVPTFSMSSGLTLGDFGWGSQTFNKMGREKIQLIQTFTKWGQDVLISDVDTVWMQNPLEYVAKVCLDALLVAFVRALFCTAWDFQSSSAWVMCPVGLHRSFGFVFEVSFNGYNCLLGVLLLFFSSLDVDIQRRNIYGQLEIVHNQPFCTPYHRLMFEFCFRFLLAMLLVLLILTAKLAPHTHTQPRHAVS
jgi:hypothetical protein